MKPRTRRARLLSGTTALFLVACTAPERAPTTALPLPTEHRLDPGAEAEQKSRRKAWFAERHRGVPGTDVDAIEEANGLAQMQKRNDVARDEASAEAAQVASNWVERGSDNQAGRMHVAVYSTDGQTLYAGSSKGGVWKGSLDGTSWTPIGDNLYGGAHWLAVVSGESPGDPDVVLAASDDGRVQRSADDGATWLPPAGLPSLGSVRRLLVTSDGTETVFLMARASNRSRLYRSTDRMASFQEIRNLGNSNADLWTPRTGGSDLYALGNGNFLRSEDLGDTWSVVSTLPSGASSGELAGSEAGAPRFWIVIDVGGNEELHRSDDGGETWTFVRNVTDYWGSLNASIADPDVFAWGGVEVWRTTNAGASFAKVNSWSAYYSNPAQRLHADIPGIDVWPAPGGEIWYVATDGGLYESLDLLGSVNNLSLQGLRVSQYYSTHTAVVNPERVLAGAQDQGYQRADTPPGPAGTTLPFDQLISGDYGHIVSKDNTHAYVFSVYPGFVLCHVGGADPQLYQEDFPGGESHAWLPPLAASNADQRDFFFCATRLWQYRWQGSRDWAPVLWSSHDFQTVGGEYLSAFTFSPVDSTRAYAATNRGRLYWSDDSGVTWTPSATIGPNAHYFYGTALLASSLDEDTLWVGGSGYGTTAVYRSTDGGATFVPWDDGLPDTLVYCLGEAPDGSGVVFCGTETSAYMRGPTDPAWVDVTGNDAPITTYWSVEALAHEPTMRFGTYGRGIWDYQIVVQARTSQENGGGTNALCFASTSDPELGSTWSLTVDASGHPGATLSGFVLRDAPSSGTFLGASEILVDLGGAKILKLFAPSSGALDTFQVQVPADPSYAGLQAWGQAFLAGGAGIELCNALAIVLGA